MKKIAVVPTYRPDSHLYSVVKELIDCSFFVVVVNDGSEEGYDTYFKELPKSEKLVVLTYKKNQGKGYALKYAFDYIRNNNIVDYVVVTMDSDGQHKVSDAVKICEIAEGNNNCIVLGSRKFNKSCPIRSIFGGWLNRTMFYLFTANSVYDTQTGLRAFSYKLMDILTLSKGERYDYEMNVLLNCSKKKVKIIEEPISTIYLNNNRNSHFSPLKDSIRILFGVIKFSISNLIDGKSKTI